MSKFSVAIFAPVACNADASHVDVTRSGEEVRLGEAPRVLRATASCDGDPTNPESCSACPAEPAKIVQDCKNKFYGGDDAWFHMMCHCTGDFNQIKCDKPGNQFRHCVAGTSCNGNHVSEPRMMNNNADYNILCGSVAADPGCHKYDRKNLGGHQDCWQMQHEHHVDPKNIYINNESTTCMNPNLLWAVGGDKYTVCGEKNPPPSHSKNGVWAGGDYLPARMSAEVWNESGFLIDFLELTENTMHPVPIPPQELKSQGKDMLFTVGGGTVESAVTPGLLKSLTVDYAKEVKKNGWTGVAVDFEALIGWDKVEDVARLMQEAIDNLRSAGMKMLLTTGKDANTAQLLCDLPGVKGLCKPDKWGSPQCSMGGAVATKACSDAYAKIVGGMTKLKNLWAWSPQIYASSGCDCQLSKWLHFDQWKGLQAELFAPSAPFISKKSDIPGPKDCCSLPLGKVQQCEDSAKTVMQTLGHEDTGARVWWPMPQCKN